MSEASMYRKQIAAGEARVAVFERTYDAAIEDVWDACTTPERLARWYVPVTGDLRVGGTIAQAMMGSGTIVRCEAPAYLLVSLGGGVDELELRLSAVEGGRTLVHLEHATTLAEHEIGGQVYDAIYCMGGGYFPRLHALGLFLSGELPADYDTLRFFERPDMRPEIDRGSAAMQALLDAG